MVWAVDCGVVHLGSDGFGLRPQMKVGYRGNTLQLEVGLDDVRDGIAACAVAELRRSYTAEGNSLPQVLKTFQRKEGELAVMDNLVKLAPRLLGQIIRITHVDIPERCHILARTTVRTGVGVGAGVCLGWADTDGYHMLGIQGKVGALVKFGGDLMAGLHRDRRRVKAIIGAGAVLIELVFRLDRQVEVSVDGSELSEAEAAELEEPETEMCEAEAAVLAEVDTAGAGAPAVNAELAGRRVSSVHVLST